MLNTVEELSSSKVFQLPGKHEKGLLHKESCWSWLRAKQNKVWAGCPSRPGAKFSVLAKSINLPSYHYSIRSKLSCCRRMHMIEVCKLIHGCAFLGQYHSFLTLNNHSEDYHKNIDINNNERSRRRILDFCHCPSSTLYDSRGRSTYKMRR